MKKRKIVQIVAVQKEDDQTQILALTENGEIWMGNESAELMAYQNLGEWRKLPDLPEEEADRRIRQA